LVNCPRGGDGSRLIPPALAPSRIDEVISRQAKTERDDNPNNNQADGYPERRGAFAIATIRSYNQKRDNSQQRKMGLILFILSVIVSIGLAVWFYLPKLGIIK